MDFVQNWPFPPSFYFRKYILERENAFQGEKNQEAQRDQKLRFF